MVLEDDLDEQTGLRGGEEGLSRCRRAAVLTLTGGQRVRPPRLRTALRGPGISVKREGPVMFGAWWLPADLGRRPLMREHRSG
jgi:hypothetical protein